MSRIDESKPSERLSPSDRELQPSAKAKTLSFILKLTVIVSAVTGVYMSAAAGRGTFMGGSRVFMFFTIQSNIAIALICAIGLLMLRLKTVKRYWFVLKFIFTVSITLTGIVFVFVLAPTLGSHAWNVQNVLTHVVVPIAAIVDFFVTGVYGDVRKRHVPLVTLPPLAYAVYVGIGYAAGWEFLEGINYPYFFLNWGSPAGAIGFTDRLPFMGTVWWILAILGFLLLAGYGYLALLALLKKRRAAVKSA